MTRRIACVAGLAGAALIGGAFLGVWALARHGDASQPATSICIDGTVGDSTVAALASTIERLQDELRDAQEKYLTDHGEKADGGVQRLYVAVGCPAGLKLPPVRPAGEFVAQERVVQDAVQSPSAFNVKMFVIADKSPEVFLGAPYRRVAYDVVCLPNGSGCAEVTTAVYLPASSVGDRVAVRDMILDAIGILSSTKYPGGRPLSEGDGPKVRP